mmetsp:Transcript_43275/g.100290  ORF Transcript_43275/g.100290 Transcript_43275/m.100290 type:complete len:384 (+) Transcript_43275:151-1302(+)
MPRGGALAIAIATTVWVRQGERGTNHGDVCGIVKWCRDASHFAAALPVLIKRSGLRTGWDGRVDVVVSTNDPLFTRSECPQPRIIISVVDPKFIELSDAFSLKCYNRDATRARIKSAGGKFHLSPEPFDRALLVKWALVGLVKYDLVLSIDNDVDFFEVGRRSPQGVDAYMMAAARAWAVEVPAFLKSPARMLGTPDFESPTNMGMVWLKPSTAYFEEGVALLRTKLFSPELGFNNSGRPRDLMSPHMANTLPMNATRLVTLNTWNIVAGASDQGLYTLIFTMRHNALQLTKRDDYELHHFWSSSKPWVRQGSCLPYFYQLGLIDAPGDEPDRTVPPNILPTPMGRRQEGQCWPLFRKVVLKLTTDTKGKWRWKCRGASFRVF